MKFKGLSKRNSFKKGAQYQKLELANCGIPRDNKLGFF